MFFQLKDIDSQKTKVLLILSDACELVKIRAIASKNQLNLKEIHRIELTFEANFIFELALKI